MEGAIPIPRPISPRAVLLCCATAVVCLQLSACAEPRPRSFQDFMDDRIAREGTLVRCDASPTDTQNDIECANARRAEATVALKLERERREELERESERKINELSQRIAERERLARDAAREAVEAQREAYEALWRQRIQNDGTLDPVSPGSPIDAAPEAAPAELSAGAN